MKKRLKINKLRDKVFAQVSIYIRNQGVVGDVDKYNKCITCEEMYPVKELDAGHFRHGKDRECYFDEDNIHPQCKYCNSYKNVHVQDVVSKRYTLFMIDQYGEARVEELINSPKTTWKRSHLEELYEKYKELNNKEV